MSFFVHVLNESVKKSVGKGTVMCFGNVLICLSNSEVTTKNIYCEAYLRVMSGRR